MSVTIGDVWLDDALLVFRILLGGFVTKRALLFGPPFLRSADAIRFATAVYSQLDCRLTQARQGRPRSHFVLRSTHSRHERVGLFRFCFAFSLPPSSVLTVGDVWLSFESTRWSPLALRAVGVLGYPPDRSEGVPLGTVMAPGLKSCSTCIVYLLLRLGNPTAMQDA